MKSHKGPSLSLSWSPSPLCLDGRCQKKDLRQPPPPPPLKWTSATTTLFPSLSLSHFQENLPRGTESAQVSSAHFPGDANCETELDGCGAVGGCCTSISHSFIDHWNCNRDNGQRVKCLRDKNNQHRRLAAVAPPRAHSEKLSNLSECCYNC